MKRFLLALILFTCFAQASGNDKDSTIYYYLPDSVKAISFMADFSLSSLPTKNEAEVGIQTNLVKLFLESDKKERVVEFEFPSIAKVVATGIGVKSKKNELYWSYNWSENENYKLMIAMAGDSAGNFALYTGYVFLPEEKKWKLIGTCKIEGTWGTIRRPSIYSTAGKKSAMQMQVNESWCQRQNGSWKNLLQGISPNPVVNLLSHVDSLEQSNIDRRIIEMPGIHNKVDVSPGFHEGIYYSMMKEGTGRQVSVNDTVTVYYKGYLFIDNSVFDETKEKPATFPLKRLITGWQIGVPLCKVGGKIKIIIPSGLAYSIRTRAAKIPPNSILVFEVEVVEVNLPR